MFDRRMARADRLDEQEQEAYEDAFERIESRLIAEHIANGGGENYRPDGAKVHILVLEKLKQRKREK